MRFSISKIDLTNVLATVGKGMSSRSTLPILSGILIEAGLEQVTFQTTDLEISIRHKCLAAIDETGRTVVPGKILESIVKELPDAAVTISTSEDQVTITCLDTSFTLSTMNPADFPYFPSVETKQSVKLGGPAIADAVKKVSRAVSKDESRAILTGVLFTVGEGKARLVATDSYRLAIADLPIEDANVEDFQAIIPGKIFMDVSRLAASYEMLEVAFSDNQIVFSFGNTILVSRKIEGTYPNYRQLLPKEKALSIKVDAKVLATSVKRVALLAQSHTPVRFDFFTEEQQIRISARTQDVGGAVENLPATLEGQDMAIAFNHQYLLDGITSIDGEVEINLQTSLKPGILKQADSDDFLYLAMPVRLS